MPQLHRNFGGWPGLFLDPRTRSLRVMPGRRDAILEIEPQRRFIHQAGVDTLQVVVPKTDDLGHEIHLRTRDAFVWIEMRPGTHQDPERAFQMFGNAKRRVAERVRPAAEKVDRHFDIVVAFRNRSVPPHFVMGLVLQPLSRPVGHRVEPLAPHIPPAFADDPRIGWKGIVELHDRAPPEIVAGQHAAVEVDVFQPAVVRAHDRCDRLERRRSPRRNLERIVRSP